MNVNELPVSLRDWFAGQAVAGWLASTPPEETLQTPEDVAVYAYKVADAMLKAREERAK